MSKERARQRALREAEKERARLRAAKESAKQRRGQRIKDRLMAPLQAEARERSALQKMRSQQNAALLAGLLLVNVAVALWWTSWGYSALALVVSAVSWPFLVLMFFDRSRR